MHLHFNRIISQFRNGRTLLKIFCDTVVVIFVALVVFWILPHKVTFFELASAHTTPAVRWLHTLVAVVAIVLSRSLLCVYGTQWHATQTYQFLCIVVADMIAGILYYIITEFVMGSVYPFLLTLSFFTLIDILSLFIRLGYKGLCDEYYSLQGNKKDGGGISGDEAGEGSSVDEV